MLIRDILQIIELLKEHYETEEVFIFSITDVWGGANIRTLYCEDFYWDRTTNTLTLIDYGKDEEDNEDME